MGSNPRIGLLVTCLVDMFRPGVGFAAVKLLEDSGCTVAVPPSQTCCGQPAYNSGDRASARALALAMIRGFAGFDYVVVPSGSCAAMVRHHYPELFADDPELGRQARELADRTWELVSFLTDVMKVDSLATTGTGAVTYHDSCSGLRELGIKDQPRRLLALSGREVLEMAGSEECCGFGGTFCVKYPEISAHLVGDKAAAIAATGAPTILAGDLGCLMNMAGKLKRDGSAVQVRHVAEVLAGMENEPAIGEEG